MTTPNTLPANGGVSDALPEPFCTICDDGYWVVNPRGPHGHNHVNAGWPSKKAYTEEQVREILAQSRQPSAQGGEPEPVALAFPHSQDFSETKCPDCGKKFYVEREFSPPPAGGGKEAKYDPRMMYFEKEKGTFDMRVEGLSMREIKDIFEQEYGALMWSEGCAYPADNVKLQFTRADLTPRAGKKG